MSKTVWTLIACAATFLLGIGAAKVMPEGENTLADGLRWDVTDGMLNLRTEAENGAFLVVGATQQSEEAAEKWAKRRKYREQKGREHAMLGLHAQTVSLPVEQLQHLTVYQVTGVAELDPVSLKMKVCACVFPPPPMPRPGPLPLPLMSLLTTKDFTPDDLTRGDG